MRPENGARISRFRESRRGERDRGLHDLQVVLGLIARLTRDEALLLQVDGAVVLCLRERQVRLRLQDLGFVDRGVELDEHRALRDRSALLESDRADAAGHLRAQGDGLVGTQAADRGDRLRHRRRRGGDRFDDDRRSAAGPCPAGRRPAWRRRTCRGQRRTRRAAGRTSTLPPPRQRRRAQRSRRQSIYSFLDER